jgi:hypothetical protein
MTVPTSAIAAAIVLSASTVLIVLTMPSAFARVERAEKLEMVHKVEKMDKTERAGHR